MASPLSIRHLRAFTEVAHCGSFTRAAQHLHQTQSALTATIKQLEEEVGLKLLDRTTRRVLLTAEGERFLPSAERLLSDFDTAIDDLQQAASQQRGQVGIASSPSTLSRLLPPVIRAYRLRYPKISLQLRDDSAGGIEQRVLANEVDFGIASNHSDHPELSYQSILKDRYGVVVPHDHPLAQAQVLSWQQLANEAMISLSGDTGIRAQLQRLGALNPNAQTDLEVSNPAAQAALIDEGLGITVLPALATATCAFDNLHFVPLIEPVVERTLCLISRRGRALSPAAKGLKSTLLEHLAQHEYPPAVVAVIQQT